MRLDFKSVFALTACAILSASAAFGQEWASPIYKLPAEAAGVEYAWKSRSEGDKKEKKGTLKISVDKRTPGTDGRWVVFAMIPSDADQPSIWRKALFDETAFDRDRNPRTAVKEVWGKQGSDAAYLRLPLKERDALLGLGIEGKLRLNPMKTQVKLSTGTFQSQFAESEFDANKKFHYQVWLVPEIPFGWKSFAIHGKGVGGERPIFMAEFVGVFRP